MKNVVIIGAGIAGLSAGVYARGAGYDVDVFEAHSLPGGLCTAWKREGFVFDGCIHYLVGTSPENPFYRLWEEVGAVQNREFVYPDALATATDRSGRTAVLYCDPFRLEEHLLRLAPDDAEVSREFCRLVRAMQRVPVPLDKAPERMGILDAASFLWRLRPVMKDWAYCFKTSIQQFAGRFRDPLVRPLLEGTMDPRSPVFNLVTVLGQLARHEAGYPIGGSLPFARAIEGRLRNLGGKVHYNARVTRIAVEAGRAIGIDLEGGTRQRADFVVGAGDLRAQLDVLLEGRFRSPAHERLFREAALCVPCVQISFGLDRRFSSGQYVVSNQLELEEPIPFPGGPLRWIHWSCHDHDPTLAPPGGSVVTCILPTEFDAWSELGREASAYREAKTSVASAAAQALEGPMPGFSRAVRTVDVATPLTVRRYTGNFRGSYMTWLGPVQREIIPKNVPGLDRFLMAGMWVSAPGGLPSAVKSGRDAVDVLRHSVPR